MRGEKRRGQASDIKNNDKEKGTGKANEWVSEKKREVGGESARDKKNSNRLKERKMNWSTRIQQKYSYCFRGIIDSYFHKSHAT